MIRLQRIGRTNDPAFRVVVLEKARAAKTGRIVEQVGTYNPKTKAFTVDADRIKVRKADGAQISPSLMNLLITKGVLEGKKVNVLPRKHPIKKEAEAAPVPTEAQIAAPEPEEASTESAAETLPEAPAVEEAKEEVKEEEKPAEVAM